MSPTVRDLVRAEVRALLEAAPAYGSLSGASRRELARGMVRLGTYLADDPAWLSQAGAPPRPEVLPLAYGASAPLAHALEETAAQGTGGSFRAGAATAGTEQFRDLVGAVDFASFVAGLIKGVFEAIVQASIEQMRAFQDLVAAASSSLSRFESEVSDNDSSGFLSAQFPSSFGLLGGALQGKGTVGDDLVTQLGLPKGSNLMDQGVLKLAMSAARQKMAAQRQQSLATIVMMGINRIVVTDGRINARVLFDVTAKDSASDERSSDSVRSQTHNENANSKKGWGAGGSSSSSGASLAVRTASSAKDASEISLHAQLSGEVSVNFKSETFPLERLAPGKDLQRIQQNAQANNA